MCARVCARVCASACVRVCPFLRARVCLSVSVTYDLPCHRHVPPRSTHDSTRLPWRQIPKQSLFQPPRGLLEEYVGLPVKIVCESGLEQGKASIKRKGQA